MEAAQVRRRLAGAAAGLVATLAVASGCAFGPPDPVVGGGTPPKFPTPSANGSESEREAVATVLAKGLATPWGLAFLPDGAALVTERNSGRILRVGPEVQDKALKVTELRKVAESVADGEGGLMGIALSPDYAKDQSVFVYYSTAGDNRIAKLALTGNPAPAPVPIVTGIPRSQIHNGGRLAFGPDGFLYATTGDGSQKDLSQDPKSLAGKILRMTPDGKPAPGNPDAKSLVYSTGHRNVQGIAWDDAKRMYATEFGQSTVDELNLIQPGKNYGWPAVEGTGNDAKYTNPLVTWPVADSSCSGLAVLERLVIAACLRGERLWLVETTQNGTVLGKPQALFTGEYGRLRTVATAPDGSLWFTTSNTDGRGEPGPDDDRIIRLVFPSEGAGRT